MKIFSFFPFLVTFSNSNIKKAQTTLSERSSIWSFNKVEFDIFKLFLQQTLFL